jgi:hypothetical protein
MHQLRRRLLAVAAAVGLFISLLTPGAAHAAYFGAETDYAVASSAPSGTEGRDYFCSSKYGVVACFMPYGDKIYVADTVADGYAAVGEWSTWTSPTLWREGSCVNKLTAGTWGVCNKNFTEGWSAYVRSARYNSGKFVDAGPYKHTTA